MTVASHSTAHWYRPIATPKTNWLPSALLLSIVFIGFRPFSNSIGTVSVAAQTGGDIVNQIGFGILGLASLILLSRNVSRHVLSALVTPTWFLVFAILMVSIGHADAPAAAMRAMVFSLIVVLVAVTALVLLRNMAELVSALGFASILTVVMCYVAVLAVPEQGIHSGGGFEAQHEGLWRGVYPHKNLASYVMGGFAIVGWFVMRNGKPFMGLCLMVLAVIFTIFAGSKTVLGVLPVAFLTIWLANWISWSILRALVVMLPVVGLVFATLGAVIHPPILEELRTYIPNLSYTGRTDLWMFGLHHLGKVPWLGFGFESFWGTKQVTGLDQPIDLSWDVRGIVHGHNSWMDSMIIFGIPGGLLICFAVFLVPVRDFLRAARTGNAGKLAELYMAIVIFMALGASLESFFFRRADPMWFFMLLGIIGLRLTAHLSANHHRAPIRR